MRQTATSTTAENPTHEQITADTERIVVSHQSVATFALVIGLLTSTIGSVWFMSREFTRIEERGTALQEMMIERHKNTDEKINLLREDVRGLSERLDHLMSQ